MKKFNKYLREQEESRKEFYDRVEKIFNDNEDILDESVAMVQQALGGIKVISNSAINKFAAGSKSDAEILYLLSQNIGKFPKATQDAIKKLYQKHEKIISAWLEHKNMGAQVKDMAKRSFTDGWGTGK